MDGRVERAREGGGDFSAARQCYSVFRVQDSGSSEGSRDLSYKRPFRSVGKSQEKIWQKVFIENVPGRVSATVTMTWFARAREPRAAIPLPA